jgi:hypothetical protein
VDAHGEMYVLLPHCSTQSAEEPVYISQCEFRFGYERALNNTVILKGSNTMMI